MGLGRTSLWNGIKAALREGPAEHFLVACSQLSSHLSLALLIGGSLSPAPSLGIKLRGQREEPPWVCGKTCVGTADKPGAVRGSCALPLCLISNCRVMECTLAFQAVQAGMLIPRWPRCVPRVSPGGRHGAAEAAAWSPQTQISKLNCMNHCFLLVDLFYSLKPTQLI